MANSKTFFLICKFIYTENYINHVQAKPFLFVQFINHLYKKVNVNKGYSGKSG